MRGPMQDLSAGPNARPKRGASLSSDFVGCREPVEGSFTAS